ncbi:60S acidic ribosomal protein po putative [Entamoeba histolytica]|uniref:Ribosome assembly factor mrt4 n=4 Tax=Entamoeba TaxID=5758 RepID=C4MAY8_ENTH1|nr:60S acidic ribosomal protein PO, putative [Entamoeba histolytica HM-1:IMSS]EAL43111.1 60S acidic ribosomal protein PO, putative [Entamoeba histolytica HM-1:IMSS]GAT99039.1 60S acidic ribosomal protein po putative [Entamoeba histolytica]|eukprot:XP_648494.1 60S acidic ribosomal protein PO, putative [Entamoeba histolytica HM-1:IMSS]
MSREQQGRRVAKKEIKNRLITNIQEAAQKYSTVFIFYTPVLRSKFMNIIRKDWRDSIFFFGSNKVMQVALGRTEQDEIKPGYHFIAERLKGTCGLCFTNKKKEEILAYFKTQIHDDFARSGSVATMDFVVPEGPLPFEGSLELHLRKNLLPVELKDGILSCKEEYVVCKKGQKLTPQAARLLEYFDIKMAVFEIRVLSIVQDGKFEELESIGEDETMQMEEEPIN